MAKQNSVLKTFGNKMSKRCTQYAIRSTYDLLPKRKKKKK